MRTVPARFELMWEMGASPDAAAAVALVVISFFSYLAAEVFRKWPEKVREYVEGIDGSVLWLSTEAHRALIKVCGRALLVMSLGALLAAALVA